METIGIIALVAVSIIIIIFLIGKVLFRLFFYFFYAACILGVGLILSRNLVAGIISLLVACVLKIIVDKLEDFD